MGPQIQNKGGYAFISGFGCFGGVFSVSAESCKEFHNFSVKGVGRRNPLITNIELDGGKGRGFMAFRVSVCGIKSIHKRNLQAMFIKSGGLRMLFEGLHGFKKNLRFLGRFRRWRLLTAIGRFCAASQRRSKKQRGKNLSNGHQLKFSLYHFCHKHILNMKTQVEKNRLFFSAPISVKNTGSWGILSRPRALSE